MNNLFFANNENRYLEQKCPPPQKPACTPPKPPPPPPKRPKPPKAGPQKPKKKKVDFKQLKNNTCKSLNEVEYFLNNFQKFTNCIKLYKILK
ncbi:MAG: hypothetical protein ACLR4X_07230 [Clostridia bacterium]